MVITLTASGEAIEAGLSFRTTVYSRDIAHGIAAGMLDSIRRLKDC
jgi:hypothetical protein